MSQYQPQDFGTREDIKRIGEDTLACLREISSNTERLKEFETRLKELEHKLEMLHVSLFGEGEVKDEH